jgi:hypothetical protein
MSRSASIFFTISLLVAAMATPVSGLETGVLRGQVRDAAGAPVAGAEIFIYQSDDIKGPADFISAATRENGEFKLSLPSGSYWAIARSREGSARYGPLQPGDRHSGEPLAVAIKAEAVLQEDFVVADLREAALLMKKTDADFHSVQGRILGENGQPVENAYAFAYTSALVAGVPAYLSLWTDASGRYTLFLPAGEYYFGQATEFPPEPASRSLKKIRIEGNMEMIDIRWDYSS